MFTRVGKKINLKDKKVLKDLIFVEPGQKLLLDEKRQELITKIKQHSGFDDDTFNQYALPLIKQACDYFQLLPDSENGYYSNSGGLIDYVLNRTEAALFILRQFLILENNTLSNEQKCWVYVLFSAGILQGIGKIYTDYQVDLYDQKGVYLKGWNPLLENITHIGHAYFFQFSKEDNEELRKRLNILIAKSLISQHGFAWIASHKEALAIWLALLNEDIASAGTLGAILTRAKGIAQQRQLNDLLLKGLIGKGGRSRLGTFIDSTTGTTQEKERGLAMEFVQWLIQKLESGEIMINKAPLLMVPGGMLMLPEVFSLFVREHPEYKNWQSVQRAFIHQQLHHAGVEGDFSRFEQTKNQQIYTGLLIKDYASFLPEQIKMHHINTGKTSILSALELIQMAKTLAVFNQQEHSLTVIPLNYLSTTGKWQPTESIEAHLKWENKTRG